MLTNAQKKDFEERSQTINGRSSLIELRNGEIDAMIFHGTEYQADRRRKKFYRAWEENCEWIKSINEVLGLDGWVKLTNPEAIWKVEYQV